MSTIFSKSSTKQKCQSKIGPTVKIITNNNVNPAKPIKLRLNFWLLKNTFWSGTSGVSSDYEFSILTLLNSLFSVGKFIDCTGKSLSEALIFASDNLQYDDRLFIELQV